MQIKASYEEKIASLHAKKKESESELTSYKAHIDNYKKLLSDTQNSDIDKVTTDELTDQLAQSRSAITSLERNRILCIKFII